jgi:hypothetical protein
VQLKSVFANRKHRPEREAVTSGKLLVGLSLTSVKGGSVHHNLESDTCDSFSLLKGTGIPR